MYTFLIPDLHGRPVVLERLLKAAGVLDDDGKRHTQDPGYEWQVVSIGDLLNATLPDLAGDEKSLLLQHDWIDMLIVGNHEIEYIYPDMNMGFSGYYAAPHMISQYRSLFFQGKVVPALLLGETLVTHAGVNQWFNWHTAKEAYKNIWDVWERLPELHEREEKFSFEYHGHPVEMPKESLITAVAKARNGSYPFGGILWSDWSEAKNTNFSQIVGHTPIPEGPVLHEYKGAGVFTLNIDCAAKSGLNPVGVWVDEFGLVADYVTLDETEFIV